MMHVLSEQRAIHIMQHKCARSRAFSLSPYRQVTLITCALLYLLAFEISNRTTNVPVMSVRMYYSLEELVHPCCRALTQSALLIS